MRKFYYQGGVWHVYSNDHRDDGELFVSSGGDFLGSLTCIVGMPLPFGVVPSVVPRIIWIMLSRPPKIFTSRGICEISDAGVLSEEKRSIVFLSEFTNPF